LIIVDVLYLYGEWITAASFMALAFLVAVGGVFGLGWWVMRGDALNRRHEVSDEERAQQH
jgi:hypothetical protein